MNLEEIKVNISRSSPKEVVFRPEGFSLNLNLYLVSISARVVKDNYYLDLSDFVANYNEIGQVFSENESLIPVLSEDLIKYINDLPDYTKKEKLTTKIKDIQKELDKKGFKRKLKKFQLTNVKTMMASNSMANFSVPGAGKTTDALAFYTLKKGSKRSKLFVISPINAYLSWKDDIKNCLGSRKKI